MKAKLKYFFLLSWVFLFVGATGWWHLDQSRRILQLTAGEVGFESNAPLEFIEAASSELKGVINPVNRQFAFAVAIRTFDGFNNPLQKEHFNENYLESDLYTRGSYVGKIIETIDFSKDGTFYVRSKGMLNIHGVKQERIIKSFIKIEDGKLTVRADFKVSLKDHNIPVPKVVHQKIAENIKVSVEGTFKWVKKRR